MSRCSCVRAVYPRVCGGTKYHPATTARRTGLSPRVRGNPSRHLHGSGRHGSIPACAGEPARVVCRTGMMRVYPRVCGGTCTSPVYRKPAQGLSPRVRGNQAVGVNDTLTHRSIPACAGEPTWPTPQASSIQVYPRVCGGTCRRTSTWCPPPGLSPRVRGNRIPIPPPIYWPRSIPACAGEPKCTQCPPQRGTVYPRVCGGTLRHSW